MSKPCLGTEKQTLQIMTASNTARLCLFFSYSSDPIDITAIRLDWCVDRGCVGENRRSDDDSQNKSTACGAITQMQLLLDISK